jgi:hypothetical protein
VEVDRQGVGRVPLPVRLEVPLTLFRMDCSVTIFGQRGTTEVSESDTC